VPDTSDKVGVGVAGSNFAGTGPDGAAVPANGVGVDGFNADTGIGVRGHSPNGTGVQGTSDIVGVRGSVETRFGFGVWGESNGGKGVIGRSFAGAGSIGVSGESDSGTGVSGTSTSTLGIGVSATSPLGFGVFARGQIAGFFLGPVTVNGDHTVIGGNKSFKIDHPLDPQNKYLLHNAVEAPERKNVYDGVAQLDEDGEAWVELPEWFEALNGDFRYQLTAVGGSAPRLHVAEEISESRFKIAGGEEGMKVCWQVTGTRKDPWATTNPFEVEQEKPEEERGRYLDPSLYDAPEEQRVMIGPPIPEAVEEEQRPPPQPSGIDFARLEEEHRRQLDEWRRREEEHRREMEELRRRMGEWEEEAPPEST
jgi:hypothetical protein